MSPRLDWKFGQANDYTRPYHASFQVKAGRHETIRISSTASRGELQVPYTVILRSKSNVEVETKGTWYGLVTWNPHHTLSVVE
ncbi:hypothetical protein MIND_00760700 [Mycena indigotica]|uniref:Uncharacterized protein n=1 Tax=Mycena indigotica TaxID=2126181 RepID=A0A8H6SNM2_9AGAR|nr:uncharacterized protein MIND_00760700 [Mycena indigotica]KAF7301946.1 hypothetical protein MIND_00760700 [Mycena indigotica]